MKIMLIESQTNQSHNFHENQRHYYDSKIPRYLNDNNLLSF